MTIIQESTQSRILTEAVTIFQQKGLHGARMQEIADKAGINKAMLHYYFKTKEELFQQVFQQALDLFIAKIELILTSELPLAQIVSQYVDHTLDALSANPTIPAFVLHEINRDPQRMSDVFAGNQRINLAQFAEHFPSADEAQQFFTDMVALCVYPFVAQPMLEKVLDLTPTAYLQFIQQRKKHIKDRLLNQPLNPINS